MIRTQNNYDYRESSTQWFDPDIPSVTVPNEAYSISELMVRHRTGLMTDLGGKSYLDERGLDMEFDDPDFSKVNGMDLVDQEEMIDTIVRNKAEAEAALKADEDSSNFEQEAIKRGYRKVDPFDEQASKRGYKKPRAVSESKAKVELKQP